MTPGDSHKNWYVPALLRVAAVQLSRLDPEDRAALLPFVKRDMEETV